MVIKRVGPLSVAKLFGILYAVLGLVFGGIFSLLALAGFGPNSSENAGMGAIVGVGAVVVFPIFYACVGFVGTLICAWLYNVAAGVVGGVQVDAE